MLRASSLKKVTPTKLISKEKAQQGVVISKKDEKAHPEDFKYITTKERKAGEAALKAKAAKKVAKKAKGGGKMGKCKGGC